MQTNTNSPLRHVSFVENEVKLNKNKLKKIPASRKRIPSSSSNNNISKRKSILLINKYNDDQEDYSDDEELTVKKTSWIKRLFQYKKKKTTTAPTIKKEEEEEEEHTISESTQKAIYELSRLKLTNPKRPLRHQVVVSNFLLQCT